MNQSRLESEHQPSEVSAEQKLFSIIPEAAYRELQQAISLLPGDLAAQFQKKLAEWAGAAKRNDLHYYVISFFVDCQKAISTRKAQDVTPEAIEKIKNVRKTLFQSLRWRIIPINEGDRPRHNDKRYSIVGTRAVKESTRKRCGEILEVVSPLILDKNDNVVNSAEVITVSNVYLEGTEAPW